MLEMEGPGDVEGLVIYCEEHFVDKLVSLIYSDTR